MDGDIYGKLDIKGPAKRPQMEGNLNIKDGGMTVDYMGAHYYFDQIDVQIEKNKVLIPETTITDKLNNQAKLKGEITYSNFEAWNFKELSIRSENLVLMETTVKQNPDFLDMQLGK